MHEKRHKRKRQVAAGLMSQLKDKAQAKVQAQVQGFKKNPISSTFGLMKQGARLAVNPLGVTKDIVKGSIAATKDTLASTPRNVGAVKGMLASIAPATPSPTITPPSTPATPAEPSPTTPSTPATPAEPTSSTPSTPSPTTSPPLTPSSVPSSSATPSPSTTSRLTPSTMPMKSAPPAQPNSSATPATPSPSDPASKASEEDKPLEEEPEDPQNPVNQMKADITKLIEALHRLQGISRRSKEQDDEMGKHIRDLKAKKEDLKILEAALDKENPAMPDVATNNEVKVGGAPNDSNNTQGARAGPEKKPGLFTRAINAVSGKGKSNIENATAEPNPTLPNDPNKDTAKESTLGKENPTAQETPASSDEKSGWKSKLNPFGKKKSKLEKEKAKLENLGAEADMEIARADVKLIYDYVQKTSEPRALKALFEYQQGRDKKEDTLSKHYATVQAIRDNEEKKMDKKDKQIIKKADALLNEIHLARVKLYSVNIEGALRRIEDAEGDINFFPDELRTEMTEKQKRITTGILVVFSIVKYIFKQFGKAPTSVRYLTLLSLAVVIFSAILAIMYCARIVNDYVNNKLINNPTNAESLEFLIANFGNSPPREVNQETNANMEAKSKKDISLSSNPLTLFFIDAFKKGLSPLFANMLSAKYKYGWFVILPWISLLFVVIALVQMGSRREKHLEITPGLVQVVLYATLAQSVIALFANHAIFFYAYYVLKGTSFRIDNYNKHVLANMAQRADFLAYLQKLPTNSIGIANVSRDALKTLFRNGTKPTKEDLAKAIFSLNLYEHYQQLGYRNPILYEALDSFRIYTFIFSKQSFSPALYLRRRATLIRDNGEKYRSRIVNIFSEMGLALDNKLIDDALIISSRATAEANNLANAFYPEDAMSRFLRMAVMIVIVQCLPFLLFIWLFRKQDLRNGFIDAIRIILGQKKQNEDADIYDKEDQVNQIRDMMRNKKEQEGEKEKPAEEEKPANRFPDTGPVNPPSSVPPPPNRPTNANLPVV